MERGDDPVPSDRPGSSRARGGSPSSSTDAAALAAGPDGRERGTFLVSAAAIALGIALVGSLETHRELAGAILLAGWVLAVYALHRLGRVGSSRAAPRGTENR